MDDNFTGQALVWLRVNRQSVSFCDELAKQLRHEFEAADYDDYLLEEIKKRAQSQLGLTEPRSLDELLVYGSMATISRNRFNAIIGISFST
ncbi:hypothetical protein FQA39_LY01069 [Lamprigera yunnana]|nr:hypothetical protein FQA39_LY01069 [Lamprigera yunnana]